MRRHGRPSRPWLIAAVALFLLAGLIPIAAGPVLADTQYSSNCSVNIRGTPATGGTSLAVIPIGTVISASGAVSGGTWSGSCPGSVAGSSWYQVTAVNGASVQTLYNVPVAYAATGLFASATYLEGIDVSHYQPSVNWPSVVAAGKRFAALQATVGETYLDPTYTAYHAGAKAAGIPTAAYHYAQPLTAPSDAVIQADWFAQNSGLSAGDLIPALDIEKTGGLDPTDLKAWVQAFLDEATARLGIRPMIYTSPNFWKTSLADTTAFADAGYAVLWVAHWDVAVPSVPANDWDGVGWTFWQYTDCGAVAGVSGCVDLDRYHGLDLTPVTYTGTGIPSPSPSGVPTPPAVLNAISPIAALAGSRGITLTVQGANFATGVSTAIWNGAPLTTTVVSPTMLTAVVPASLLASPGTAAVGVTNVAAGLGGGASGTAPFTVTLPPVVLEIHPSATVVPWGDMVTLRVDTRNLGAGHPVTLQRMQSNEATWADVSTLTTDASGGATATYRPPVNTQFRAAYTDPSGASTSQADPERVVVRQLAVVRPTNKGAVKSIEAGTSVTFTATVRPVGKGLAPAMVTFQFWRLVGTRWTQFTHRDVVTDAAGKASWTWTFTVRGQWYVRALADPTTTNANSVLTPVERYSVN